MASIPRFWWGRSTGGLCRGSSVAQCRTVTAGAQRSSEKVFRHCNVYQSAPCLKWDPSPLGSFLSAQLQRLLFREPFFHHVCSTAPCPLLTDLPAGIEPWVARPFTRCAACCLPCGRITDAQRAELFQTGGHPSHSPTWALLNVVLRTIRSQPWEGPRLCHTACSEQAIATVKRKRGSTPQHWAARWALPRPQAALVFSTTGYSPCPRLPRWPTTAEKRFAAPSS